MCSQYLQICITCIIKMQILRPHPRQLNQKLRVGTGPTLFVLASPHWRWSCCTMNFENQFLRMTNLASYGQSVQFSCSVVSDSLRTQGLQDARLPCLSPTPGIYPNSCPSHQWCYPTISSSVIPFSSCIQSFPVSGSFPVSQFFTSGGQSIGVSASTSVLPWTPRTDLL